MVRVAHNVEGPYYVDFESVHLQKNHEDQTKGAQKLFRFFATEQCLDVWKCGKAFLHDRNVGI